MSDTMTMSAMDAVSGSLAECFATINGNRYHLMQLINFEGSVELTNSEVPILGKTGKGNKPSGWKGSWKATLHYNTSLFREMLLEYKKTGYLPPLEIQTSNEDTASSSGRQTIVYKDCLINGGILSKIDADAEYLDEELEGTFDDWDMPEQFNLLTGMQ